MLKIYVILKVGLKMKKLTILTLLTLANLILNTSSLDASSPKPSPSLTHQARVICAEKGILLDDKSCDGMYTKPELKVVEIVRDAIEIMEEGDRYAAVLANPESSKAEKDAARLRLIEFSGLLAKQTAKLAKSKP